MQIKLAFKNEALAANKLEMIPYTGKNGLYVSVVPRSDLMDEIVKLAEELGITVDPESIHITVMYSKQSAGKLDEPNPDTMYTALISSVDSWVGHNDKTYVVLKLVSEGITLLHGDYARRGAEPTFIPYAPHITLSDDVEVTDELKKRMEKMNNFLNYSPKLIYLTNHRIGDLSKD